MSVYLSYSTRDKDFALKITDDLKGKNIDVINEEAIPESKEGELFNTFIERILDQADIVLVIVSGNIFRCEFLWKEIELAKNKQKVIISILKEDVEMPGFILQSKVVDFSRDYSSAIQELVELI